MRTLYNPVLYEWMAVVLLAIGLLNIIWNVVLPLTSVVEPTYYFGRPNGNMLIMTLNAFTQLVWNATTLAYTFGSCAVCIGVARFISTT